MTVIEFAEALGVSHQNLSAILNGKANITPEIAIRLGKALGTSPETDIPQVAATHRVINLNYSIHGVLKQINAI
jgi:transcriptional regulator with XRE-family HTH domain